MTWTTEKQKIVLLIQKPSKFLFPVLQKNKNPSIREFRHTMFNFQSCVTLNSAAVLKSLGNAVRG